MTAILAAIRLAMRAIVRSKLRSTLTVLGILIGVAAVVIVVALGTGVQQQVVGQISNLGANVIFIFPQSTQTSGVRSSDVNRLTEADGRALVAEATSIANVAPFSSTGAQVIAGDRNAVTQVMGVSRTYFPVRGFSVGKGEMFTESEELLKAKVVIIGETVREKLFGPGDPIGQYVRIGRYPYRVVGLLTPKGQSPFGEDQDDRVLMPIGSFRARVVPSPPGRVQQLIASATDERTVDRAVAQIEAILRQRHGIAPDQDPDFGIRTQAEFRKSSEEIVGTLTVLLSSIAAVSLLVGGIGVMNIMLVSVTERTREIGIRMAIGASAADIMTQFLVEAIVLSVIGGVFGLGIGAGVIKALGGALGWSLQLPIPAVVAAMGTSAVIGIVFGFFPARRAALMDPIVALRQE
ncbi:MULTISPECIES: ABC transporter permease [Polyangium]|uniref:FtsX-like permease family protein n=2 Tax=Polyangium TaxID=55 RepID=A0A4U1JCY2_9BACT|nr:MULTISPECIES: ABC transporter permease [Polyangium]MDI1430942.1 ABC transporter permease [Polyangium sorediatum]TKD07363.1 FtsX-like permease family protein [Polyangium fumosum]